MSRILRQLTRVFLATPCPLCQRSASPLLCDSCYRQMLACQWPSSTQDHVIQSVASQLKRSDREIRPDRGALSIFSWGKYSGVLKQLLALLKYGDQPELGIWLGCQLGQQWRSAAMQKLYCQPVVVPIPLHYQRLKQRGYNQAALIAKGFCRVTGLPLLEDGLVRIKATHAMYSLGKKERQANLISAFQLGKALTCPSFKVRPILLIDDIYTTGATCDAAALTLIQTKYSVMGIAIVARTVLSSPLDELP